MQLQIRPAQLQDLTAVKAVDELLFGQDTYPLFALRQLLDITGDLLLVAEFNESIIGYAIGHYNSETKTAWFLSLGVLPEFRGQSIGEKLIDSLIETVEAKGATAIYLTVDPVNKSGFRLYEKLGFVQHHSKHNYYLDGMPRIVMVRTAL
ncbi:ribosomal-protein-alanine N-acetyltransferase [Pontibacter aydingkolensis]|uniref:GNAT family N-acetyltransferase n=1 Tax=Pontibacter aydingkolensis TaxID=1911536 RepID=A0ABS7CXM0_9BACT|nr:GNAT family N-acetyltransferase [Pontibacter aydingkolensis]MBW7468581.1 GNAT family N-acetyltransferase [Pontibacter aydingkolensis]